MLPQINQSPDFDFMDFSINWAHIMCQALCMVWWERQMWGEDSMSLVPQKQGAEERGVCWRRYDPEIDTNVQSQRRWWWSQVQVMGWQKVDGWWWKRMEHSRQGGGSIWLVSFMKPFLTLSISTILHWVFHLMDIWSPLLYFKCLRNKDAAISLGFREIPRRGRHY